jgi:HK97 family phage major capsid protein
MPTVEERLKEELHRIGEDILGAQVQEMKGELTEEIKNTFHEVFDKLLKDAGGAKALHAMDNQELDKEKRYKSLGDQIKDVIAVSQGKAPDGQGELIPSEGGFLVQPQFAQEILANMHETGQVMSRCRQITIGPNANALVFRAIDETSRAAGSRWGGIRGYWVEEGADITASKPKYRRVNIPLEKVAALSYLTDELMQDTTAAESLTNQAVAEELAFVLEDAIINGNGAGKPLGVLNAGCLVSASKKTGQTADTFIAENVSSMWTLMPAAKRTNAVWFMNQDVEPQLDKMYIPVGSSGIPVFIPPGMGFTQSPAGTLKGRPIIMIEQCPALGDNGDVLFADMSDYLLISKGGVNAASSMHVEFVSDQMALRWTYRVGGQPAYASAVTSYKGSTDRSSFVALAARS